MAHVFNDAVIETLKNGLERILDRWSIPSESELALLNISENATFVATGPNAKQKIIIRVHRPDYHTRQEIESELRWVESLRTEGIVSTARPLPLTTGGHIAVLDDQSEKRYVVGFEFLPGAAPSLKNSLRSDFFALGAVTAQLHGHAKRWAIPIGFKRKVWDYQSMLGAQPLWGDWRNALGLDGDGLLLLEKTAGVIKAHLADYGIDRSRFGLIHADLRLANLLIDRDHLSVIDFDDCGYSWFMYDFAAAISFMEESDQIPELQRNWIAGYRSVATLTSEDEAMFPSFIMLRRILLTAWLASHSETATSRELGSAYTEGTIRLAQSYLQSVH